ncbi:MAG: cobalamin B12-binding domain-containing protein [Ardenticatenaceae bacterium]
MENLNKIASQRLANDYQMLAEVIYARQIEVQPDLLTCYGERGRAEHLDDLKFHLLYLSEALASGSHSLFADYVGWGKVMLTGRNLSVANFAVSLACMRDVLQERWPADLSSLAASYIEAGLEQLEESPSEMASFIGADQPLGTLAQEYLSALLDGDRYTASELIIDAVESGVSVKEIYLHVFQKTQHEIGRLWQMNQVSIAQEHYCTAATQLIMSQLYPYIFATERKGYNLVVTCVAKELHEIGARMVADFFEMDGWDTFYLGSNMPLRGILRTLVKRQTDVLAISATLTSHISAVRELISAIHANENCQHIKVLVGGYPFNIEPELWQRVGADGHAHNAQQAIILANQLMNGANA